MRSIVESKDPNWEQLLSPRFGAYCTEDEDGYGKWIEDASYLATKDFLCLFSASNPTKRQMARGLLYRFVVYTNAVQLFLCWNEDGLLSVVEPANNLCNACQEIVSDSDEIALRLKIMNDMLGNPCCDYDE
ncbi:MAG: hypothetical protein LBJ03_00115 [Holosporales bacterium]|nr:hypothetical protein [Holosporales bacterium]